MRGCVACAAAFQHERRIRMYDVEAGWVLRKDVHCRNLRWTVTDTCSSPDGIWLAYATINPTVHLARAPHPTLPYPRSPPAPRCCLVHVAATDATLSNLIVTTLSSCQ